MSSNTNVSSSSWDLGPEPRNAVLLRSLFEDPRYPYDTPMHQYFTYQYPDGISYTPDTLPSPSQPGDLISPYNGYNSGFAGQDMPIDTLPPNESPTTFHPESPTQPATGDHLYPFLHISNPTTSNHQSCTTPGAAGYNTASHYRIAKPSTNATISGPLPLRCYWPACTYTGTFSKKGQLTRHVNTKHISPGSFECPQLGCGKAFDRKDNLGEHMRRIHLGRYSQALARSDYGS